MKYFFALLSTSLLLHYSVISCVLSVRKIENVASLFLVLMSSVRKNIHNAHEKLSRGNDFPGRSKLRFLAGNSAYFPV